MDACRGATDTLACAFAFGFSFFFGSSGARRTVFRFAFIFIAPACTMKSPFASGAVSTVARAARLPSITCSPTFSSVGASPSAG